jgi:TP901 family phage tail tape measure protein
MAEVPKSIKASLYIDGKPAESSLKNINQVARTLRRELDSLVVGTEAWNAKMREWQQYDRTLRSIQNEVRGVGGAFGWLKTEIGKLGALAVGYLGFQFITSQFHNIILANAKLSDSLAEVRRTVGLTEDEVMSLNKSFKEIDTRTSVEQLRNIAITAGKLGVAKQDVLGFVEATDKLVVTLGDELGNADQITTQLGKILNVFDGTVNGDNISRLGNAMIVMANAGVASGDFLAEFAQRVSGIAKTAGVSLGAVLGLGAGLQELGGRAESSSTAIVRLLTDIAGDLPKAARIAKTPLEEFQKLFGATPERALIKFAVGLTQNKTAFNEVAASLKEAGEEGARVISTLTAIGQRSEFMQGKIDLANESLKGMGAINEGFALKNNTFGASVDKLGKKFSELSANKGLTSALQGFVSLTSSAIDGINNHAVALGRLIKFIVAGGVAWLTYSTYVALSKTTLFALLTTMIKGESIMAVSRTATIALAGAKAILTGNFTKAAQAARLLNLTLAANPIGAMIAALAAVITLVVLFKDTTNDAAKAQQTLNKIKVEAGEKIAEEKDKIQELTKIIKDQNEKYSERIAAINALRRLIPDHLKAYTDEKILAGEAAAAVDGYVKSLERRAEAEVAQEELKRLKAEEREILRTGDDLTFKDAVGVVLTDIFAGSDAGDKMVKETGAANKMNALRTNRAQQKAITDKYREEIRAELTDKPIDGANGSASPAGKTLDSLNAKLEDLKKQKGAAIIGSKTFLDLVKQIKDVEKEIAKYDGSADKKANRAQESEVKKRIKEFESLGKEYKALGVSLLQDQLSANEKEVAQDGAKYDKLIDEYTAFYNKKGTTAKQKQAAIDKIGELEFQKQESANNIRVRQEAEMLTRIKQLRIDLGVLHESELDKEKARVNKFYDDLERENKGNESVLAQLKIDRARELTAVELNEAKRLQQEKQRIEGEGDVASAGREHKRLTRINKKYDDEIIALKNKFSKEIQATKAFQDAVDAINANRDAETQAVEADKRLKEKDAILGGAQDVSNAVFQIGENNRRAESDAVVRGLEEKRDKELSNKDLTETQKDAINKRYDKQISAEKLRAWKADQKAALTQAAINTALAVTKALPNFFLAGAAAVAGLAQAAVILKQKPPQFATGGYSDDEPAGYVGQATIFRRSASGRPFVAGEAGREWIAPNWMLQNPRTANLINMLEVARREKRAFAGGGMTNNTSISNGFSFDYSAMNQQTTLIAQQNELLNGLNQKFEQFAKKPWDYNMRAIQEYEEKIEKIKTKAIM